MFRSIFHTVLAAGSAALFLCVGVQAATISENITDTKDNEYTWTDATEITSGAVVTFTHTQNISGPITITNGTLSLGKEGGFTSVTNITVGSQGQLLLASKSPFGTDGNSRTFTIGSGGVLDFTANNWTFSNIAKLVLNGGTIQATSTQFHTDYGAYLFRDTVTCNADSTISAPFTIRAGWGNHTDGKVTWTVAKNATLTVSGQVRFQDTGATPDNPIITKTGEGTLLFTNSAKAVHADSQFIVEAGTLKFTNANAFQAGSNAMKISVTGKTTTVNNVTTSTVGKLLFEGSGTVKNNIDIASGQTVEFKPTGDTTYSGTLTGKGTFNNTQSEWKKLTLKGDNSNFEGTVGNAAGNSLLFFDGVSSALPKGTFNNGNGGTVCFLPADADHSVFQFGALTGSGTLRPSTSTSCDFTLQVGAKNTDCTFSGTLTDYDDGNKAEYPMTLALEKVGTATLTLTNASNKYRGGTVVTAGTLAYTVSGALGRGSVTVGSDTTTDPAAKLLFAPTDTSANATISDDVLIQKTGVFAITNYNSGKQIVYSGSPTGTGTLRLEPLNTYVRLTGDHSAFAGTVETTAKCTNNDSYVFFKNGQSTSKLATYNITSKVVFWSTEANQVYEYGALQMTGGEWRFSAESTNTAATMRVGNLNQDDLLQTFLQGNTKLEKVGTGTLTIKQNGTNENNYSGGTLVTAGTLDATYPSALGSGAVTVEGGTLKYSGDSVEFANNTEVQENGTFQMNSTGKTLTAKGTLTGSGKIDVQAGTFKYTGSTTDFNHDINIAANSEFRITNGATLTGDITGNGTFHISDKDVRLKGDSTQFSGTVQRDAPAFYYNGVSTSGLASYTGAGNMYFLRETTSAANVYELGSLSGKGTLRQSGSSVDVGITLKIGGNNQTTTFDGILADYAGNRTLAIVKTGTGDLTLTADLSKENLGGTDVNVKPYSGGTTVENGRLIIAKGAVIGANKGDLVLVNAVTKDATPAITLSGTIRGDLQVDGLLTIDFTNDSNPAGNVTGAITFGDAAALGFLTGESGWNQGMSYTLTSNNSADLTTSMMKLYADAISAGTVPDIFSITQTTGGVILGVDANKVPEPAAWLLLMVGAAFGVSLRGRRFQRR